MQSYFGVKLSQSFIKNWFKHRIGRPSSIGMLGAIPIDKLKPANVMKYKEYCQYVISLAHIWLVFADEKSVKGLRCIVIMGGSVWSLESERTVLLAKISATRIGLWEWYWPTP